MKELVFALEFRGSAAPVPGSDKKLQAKTSAGSQTLRSVLKADGILASVESAGGGSASFESEVEIVGEGMFVESGSIRYGDADKVSFRRTATRAGVSRELRFGAGPRPPGGA